MILGWTARSRLLGRFAGAGPKRVYVLAAASLVILSSGVRSGASVDAATIAYPDMQILVPEQDVQIYHPSGAAKELRFSHITSNLGDGPLDILPMYDPSTQTAVGYQRLYSYDANGNLQFVSQSQVADRFYFDPVHNHFHFPFAGEGLYTVNPDGSIGTPVIASPKTGFCIAEDHDANLTLPHAPQAIVYNGSTCGQPTAVRGLSVGWGDHYDWTDPGQSIDITNVPDGTYWFRSVADPNNNFQESDKTNNITDLKLQIAGDTVRVVNPLTSAGSISFDKSYFQDGTGTVSTPPINTAGPGELLLAFVGSDGPPGGGQSVTVSGGGLSWTLAKRTNAQAGTAEVWSAMATNQLSGATITSAQAIGAYDQSLMVLALGGAGGVGNVAGASAPGGAPAVSLTTSRDGAWVMGAGYDWDRGIFRTPAGNQKVLHQWVDTAAHATGWSQAMTTPTSSAGTAVQLADTVPCCDRWNFSAVEVLPPAGPPTVPAAPTAVNATAGNASATVTWTAPPNGGSAITKYTVTPYIGSTAQPSTDVLGSPPPTSVSVGGLTNGTSYTFRVTATNAVGTGAASPPSNAVTPAPPTAPAAPTGVSATAGNATATVNWIAPPNGGSAITKYTVTPYVGATAQASRDVLGSPPATSATITGLSNGTTYTFTVTATNAAGTGPPSAASNSVTPLNVPLSLDQAPVVSDGSGTRTTAAFSTSAPGELLLAFVGADGPGGTAQTVSVSGAGLSWSLAARTNTQAGTAEVWSAIATNQLSGVTVTSTPAFGGYDQSLSVLAFKGASGTGNTGTASAGSGGPSVTTSTSRAGSWVFGVGNDWDHATARTLGTNQVKQHEWVDTGSGDTFWLQAMSAPTATPGTGVVLNDTAPTNDRWNFAALEVLPSGSPAVPGAPTGVGATAGNASASVSWTPPANGGSGITRYTVTPYVGSTAQPGTDVLGSPPPTTATITGLTNGTTYTFTVTATNAVGTGPASTASNAATPTGPTAPGAPSGVSASAGNASATVSWTAPANGGSGITKYTVTPYIGTTPQPVTDVLGSPPPTSATITGLSNGTTYTFRVTASNGVGTGPASAASNPVTPTGPTVPGAPTGVSATAGNASATVSWSAPPNGGSGITRYTVTPSVGSTAQPGTAVLGSPPPTSMSIGGLTNGTTYTFTVTATNGVGTGPPSAASNPVTPASVPLSLDQPAIVSDGAGTRTTPAFSTSAPGELLLAFVGSDGPGSGQTVTVSGAGLTWNLVKRTNTQAGTAEVWSAMATNQLSGVTVTSTPAVSGYDQSLTVLAVKGAGGTGNTATASGSSGAPSVTTTTSRAGSWVFGVGNDWDHATTRTLGANQVKQHEWVDTGSGDTYWVQAMSAPTPASGTAVVLNDTAPTTDRWNFTAVEVLAR